MAWSFNPFTGNLDMVGAGALVFEGEEETFDDLPVGIGDPPVGASFLVRTSTGVWLVNRRQAGIWIRRNNTGVRATDWEYGGDYPVNSVNGQTGTVSLTASSVGAESIFDSGGFTLNGTPVTLTAARARVWTFPCFSATTVTLPTTGAEFGDRIVVRGGSPVVAAISISSTGVSDTISSSDQQFSYTYLSTGSGPRWVKNLVDSHDTGRVTSGIFNNARIDWGNPSAIGGTTPNIGAFTSLSATGQISGANTTASPPTTTGQARGLQFGFLGGNTGSTAAIYGSHPGTSTLGIGIANSAVGSITQVAAFTSTGLNLIDGSTASLSFRFLNDTDTGFFRRGNNAFTFVTGGANVAEFNTGSVILAVGTSLNWAFNDLSGSPDLTLVRDASDTLAQRRGAQPQTFRLYGQITGSDVSATGNYERGFMRWSAAGGVFQIGTEKGSGGGLARALEFQVDGQTKIVIAATGHVTLRSADTSNGHIVNIDANTWSYTANGLTLNFGRDYGRAQSYFSADEFVFGTYANVSLSQTGQVVLTRDANNTLAQRNGANGQTFRLYNTVSGTNNVNFERANFRWTASEFIIDAEFGGTGTALRGIKIGSATSSLLGFYGATPVDRPNDVVMSWVSDGSMGDVNDAQDLEARAAVFEIRARLRELGLIATT